MTTQTQFKILVLIATTALLTACGSEKEVNSNEFASRTTGAIAATTDQSSRPMAYCNRGTSALVDAHLGVYSQGDQILNEKIFVKITKIPAAFSESKHYLQFFTWQTNSKGVSSGSDRALNFDIIDIATNTYLVRNVKTLYWRDLSSVAQRLLATNPTDFFKKVRILVDLEDPYAEMDVLRLDYFDLNNARVNRVDALLPVFDADPSRYAVESNGATRPSNLQNLHPFRAMLNQGWSANKFKTESQKFCTPLSATN
jgi:hypothetical protein